MKHIVTKAVILLITAIISSVNLHAKGNEGIAFVDLFKMSGKELLAKGNEYLVSSEMPDSALICFSIAAERYSPSLSMEEQRVCTMAYNNCGFIYYYFFYDFPNAFDALLEAERLCSRFDDKSLHANICLNLGNCYSMCFQLGLSHNVTDKALQYYAEGYALARENSDWLTLLNCFTNLAMAPTVIDCPKYVTDEIRSFSTLPLPEDTPDYEFYQALYGMAVNELDGNYDRAISFQKRQLRLYSSFDTYNTNKREVKADILYGLSYSYQKSEKMDSAEMVANQLIAFSREIDRPYFEALGYQRLSAIYDWQSRYDKANQARWRFFEIKDSIVAHNNLMMVDKLEFIAQLRQDNRNYIYKEQIYKRNRMILFGVVILLSITLPLLWFLYKQNKKLRASNLALYRRQQEAIRQEDANMQARYAEEKSASAAVKRPQILAQDEVSEVKARILNVLDHDKAVFNPEFSLDKLVELTGTKPRVLSSVINEAFDRNFYSLINEYRIREACRRLADVEQYGHLTIEAISQSVGYKSRTSLVNAFKKETGLTPSEYQKIAVRQANK